MIHVDVHICHVNMSFRIWHDNMGTNPSWYFSRMQIEDLQTGDKYFFICENWLSLDDDDGLVSNYCTESFFQTIFISLKKCSVQEFDLHL